jgi:hypothetical protein
MLCAYPLRTFREFSRYFELPRLPFDARAQQPSQPSLSLSLPWLLLQPHASLLQSSSCTGQLKLSASSNQLSGVSPLLSGDLSLLFELELL